MLKSSVAVGFLCWLLVSLLSALRIEHSVLKTIFLGFLIIGETAGDDVLGCDGDVVRVLLRICSWIEVMSLSRHFVRKNLLMLVMDISFNNGDFVGVVVIISVNIKSGATNDDIVILVIGLHVGIRSHLLECLHEVFR